MCITYCKVTRHLHSLHAHTPRYNNIADYPAKEAARLGKMISGGTAAMSSEKLDDLYLRFHVLKAVVGGAAAAGSEEAAAAVGHEEL